MMISLLLITTALALGQPQADRLSVDCSVKSQFNLGEKDVTAIRCLKRKGFFVPSLRYRELRKHDLEWPFNQLEISNLERTIEAKDLVIGGLTVAATASADLARIAETAYLDERSDHKKTIGALEDTGGFFADFSTKLLWFAGGAVVAGIVVALVVDGNETQVVIAK